MAMQAITVQQAATAPSRAIRAARVVASRKGAPELVDMAFMERT